MKYSSAVAALVLVAGTVTLLGVALNTPSSAFGQALKQVREARSMTYSQLMTVTTQKEPVKTKVLIAEDGRRRSEMPGLGANKIVTIFDSSGFVRLALMEDTKTAIVEEARKDSGHNAGQMFLTWLERLQKLGDKPDKELGNKELNGKQVTGFTATQGNMTFTMWVDVATGELVQMEYDSPVNGAAQHITMTDFQFNVNLDNSLFSFDVPAGYKVLTQPEVPAVAGGETSIIEALRAYTKHDNGKFPPSIADWGPWVTLFSKDNKDGTLNSETTRVLANLGSILPFLVSMPKTDYAYLGDGKTLEQKDAIVFWYKKPDGTYRAIYSDLTAKDITAEGLPKK